MHLSSRELQVIQLLATGKTNKEIAQMLDISPHTVRDYISALFVRFGVRSRTALVAVCAQQIFARQVDPRGNDRRGGGDRRLIPRDTPTARPIEVLTLHL